MGESVESLGFDPSPRPQVPRRTALIGAGVTLVVAMAGVLGWNLWQGRAADQDLLLAVPRPVSDTPTVAWSWLAGGEVQAVYAVGEATLVEHDFDTLTALDAEGEELWTSEVGPDAFVTEAAGRDDVFVEAALSGLSVRSMADGAELWESDGRFVRAAGEWVLLHDEDRIRELDLASGRELWSAEASTTAAVDSTGVYAVENRRLTKWSHGGERLWAAAEPETTSTSFATVVPAEGFVVLGGEGIATAYDSGDGKVLWTVELGEDDVTAGLFMPDLVFAYARGSSPDDAEIDAPAEVTVLGLDGEVGSLDADGSFFYGYPVVVGDEHYGVDGMSGRFYDSTLQPRGEALGPVIQLVQGGAYLQSGRDLVFVTPPDAAEQWRLPLGAGRFPPVAVGDRRLALVVDRTVRGYE